MDNPFKRMRIQNGYNFNDRGGRGRGGGGGNHGYTDDMFDHMKDG